jgi:hypothetical protein
METTITPMHAPSIHVLQIHRSTRSLDSTKYRNRRTKPRFDAIFHSTGRGRRTTVEDATRKGMGTKVFIFISSGNVTGAKPYDLQCNQE